MSNMIKKENITIVIGEYTDNQGNLKKQYRTIGELITMQGNDGQPYQFGKLWGASGCTEIKIYPQDSNQQTAQQGVQNAQNAIQQPQQQQGGYQQNQNSNHNPGF